MSRAQIRITGIFYTAEEKFSCHIKKDTRTAFKLYMSLVIKDKPGRSQPVCWLATHMCRLLPHGTVKVYQTTYLLVNTNFLITTEIIIVRYSSRYHRARNTGNLRGQARGPGETQQRNPKKGGERGKGGAQAVYGGLISEMWKFPPDPSCSCHKGQIV